ncbi:MAG TPA: radical SAM protein [Candidatus Polarisedimenticolia bacterium]|nr:radical SAM protein [Candidatus Polarisedimenticolia bacterium]
MAARNGRPRLLLISSSHYEPDGRVARVERYWTSALTLVHLEALTPPDFSVALVDDFMREPPDGDDADLVGITAMGLQIARAYDLADRYRARGLPVVMGGEWVSLNPGQALEHCDAVVKGEAEYAWPELLADWQRGGLRRRVYEGAKLHDLRGLPAPDLRHLPLWRPELMREKVYRDFYFQFPLYVTRGCPFRCDYCCITQFHGGTYRTRPIGEVLRDLDAIRALGSRNVLFMDDNPVADRRYARELLRAMIPKGMRWCSQSTIQIAEDGELLDLAARSGCTLLSIGFETIKQSNLEGVNKGWARAADYARLIRALRRRGIQIVALIMIGLDDDEPADFDRTLEFLIRAKVPLAKFHLPVPYPGTRFYDRMEREGRILTRDWNRYHYGNAVIRPLRMSPQEAETRFWATYREFFGMRSILRRFLPPARRNLRLQMHYMTANLIFRRMRRDGRHPYLY